MLESRVCYQLIENNNINFQLQPRALKAKRNVSFYANLFCRPYSLVLTHESLYNLFFIDFIQLLVLSSDTLNAIYGERKRYFQ